MSDIQDQIKEIEIGKKEAKRMVDLKVAVERLSVNRDFKRLVLDEFFEKTAVRLVHLKSDPAWQGEKEQAELDKELATIGLFSQFLERTKAMGTQAEKALLEMDEVLEELQEEDSEV